MRSCNTCSYLYTIQDVHHHSRHKCSLNPWSIPSSRLMYLLPAWHLPLVSVPGTELLLSPTISIPPRILPITLNSNSTLRGFRPQRWHPPRGLPSLPCLWPCRQVFLRPLTLPQHAALNAATRVSLSRSQIMTSAPVAPAISPKIKANLPPTSFQ